MMFIISVVGFLGAIVLGMVGLARGDAGQLERILAIAGLAMAASGLVGRFARTPDEVRTRPHVRAFANSLGDLFSAIAIAPIVALCVGVFLLTLIPSIWVMLPVFAIWWAGGEMKRGEREPIEPTAHPAPLPEPAIV
jgi:hypothetical protein